MNSQLTQMRRLVLDRKEDVTQVSGTGIVAEGVRYSDGTVVLRWISAHRTTVVHDRGMASVRAIHGHDGKTEVVYVDPAPDCVYCYGSGVSDNAHCHCYGPRAIAGEGNLAIRDRDEAERGY